MRVSVTYGGRDFVVDHDGLQNTLYEKGVTEKGESKETVIGYYKEFGNAIHKIIKICVGERTEEMSLREFVDKYAKAVKEILELNESEF